MRNAACNLRQRWAISFFERQTKPYVSELHRLAHWLSSPPEAAEALTHDTYIRALQTMPRRELQGAVDCRRWLYRLMVETYRDHYRRKGPSEVAPQLCGRNTPSNVFGFMPTARPAAASSKEREGFAAAVKTALAGLPPEVRVATVLFFAKDMSYQEIADITACPLGTAISRVLRGRQIIWHQLNEHSGVKQLRGVRPIDATVIEFHRGRR